MDKSVNRPYSSAGSKSSSKRIDDGTYSQARKHRFETFDDVKKLIYQIYG